jgi:hypothetical protein
MSDTSQQTIQSTFASAAGNGASAGNQPLIDALNLATAGMSGLKDAAQSQTDAAAQLQTATNAGNESGNAGTASTIAGAVASLLGGGGGILGAVAGATGGAGGLGGILGAIDPLAGILDSLFDSGPSLPAPLTPYIMPTPIEMQEDTGGNAVTYGATGTPKTAANASGTSGTPAPTYNLNIQAFDNRSIADHADDIASAVNQAMLNMHPINDTILNL